MWIKVCGIRDVATARAVADCGPDAIGLNFHRPSPRCVDQQTAAEIVSLLPASVTAVGVFVNHTVAEIRRLSDACGFRTIQLHGDEPASLLTELTEFRIIRALRTDVDFAQLAVGRIAEEAGQGRQAWAWLVDAHSTDAYGGTGKTVDWESLAPQQSDAGWPPLILAGGLTPDNVATAIGTARPWGVDVASGVESAPGVKDHTLVRAFIRAVRDAS